MPRRRQPPTLRASSLHALANFILDWCKETDGEQEEEIHQYVQEIPYTFANEYVNEVIQLYSRRRYYFDITSAFHSKCTMINERDEWDFSGSSVEIAEEILWGLHVMRDLIKIGIELWLSEEWKDYNFPKMTNLLSVKVSLGANPQVLEQFIENCPILEDIEIDGIGIDDGMQSTLAPLSNCKNLKRIFVYGMTPEVAIYLLDHLPNLEVLHMKTDCIGKVLPLCTRAYRLKDFTDELHVCDIGSVQKVVTHFPYLEKLTLLEENVHVNWIGELVYLKSLTICDMTSLNLLYLMDKCMFGLQHLELYHVTGLDYLFRQNMNVAYPNLECLTLTVCTGINVAGIRQIFPNLKSLYLSGGEYIAHSLPFKMPHAGSEALEQLHIRDVPLPQVRCLIPFCSQLKSLHVSNTSVESCVYELLCNANLKELRKLQVHDDRMKREVIPIILDSCGEYLKRVHLRGSELILSPDHIHELSNQLQKYDMHFFINDSNVYDPHFI